MRRFAARSVPAENHGIAAAAGPMHTPADNLGPTFSPPPRLLARSPRL